MSEGDDADDGPLKSEKRAIIGFAAVILAVILAIVGVTIYRNTRLIDKTWQGQYVNESMGITITLPDGKWTVQETDDNLVTIALRGAHEDTSSIEILKSSSSAFELACFEDEIEESEFKGRECYIAMNGDDESFSLNYYIETGDGALCVSMVGGTDEAINLSSAQRLLNCIEITD